MPDIQLIAMDMDGTLLNSQQQISSGNAAALREARAQGIRLAICSGRSPGDLALFALENDLADCALLSLNGTYCYDRPGGNLVSDHVFSEKTAQEIIRILWESGIEFGCFSRNQVVVFRDDDGKNDGAWATHREGKEAPVLLHGWTGMEQIRRDCVNKVVCYTADKDKLAEVYEQLSLLEEVDITSSWSNNFEMMPAGANKGTAVAELAASRGLDASQVMTLGDHDNDISMIAWAGMGVAMENATAGVRQTAKFVTLTNNEDGVAYAIRRYALKK